MVYSILGPFLFLLPPSPQTTECDDVRQSPVPSFLLHDPPPPTHPLHISILERARCDEIIANNITLVPPTTAPSSSPNKTKTYVVIVAVVLALCLFAALCRRWGVDPCLCCKFCCDCDDCCTDCNGDMSHLEKRSHEVNACKRNAAAHHHRHHHAAHSSKGSSYRRSAASCV